MQHLSGQLTAAGVPWRLIRKTWNTARPKLVSASGSGVAVNPYNGTTEYNYAVKHNPMAFFTDTQNKNIYPMTNFWTDLTNGNVGRYNWITPDQYNEMHSSLPSGFTYQWHRLDGQPGGHRRRRQLPVHRHSQDHGVAAYQDHRRDHHLDG